MRKIIFVKDNIYHVYNRRTEKRELFLADADRWRFLQGLFLFNNQDARLTLLSKLERAKGAFNFRVLREFIMQEGPERKPLVRIMADCLMPNHYHLLLQEIQEEGISRFMHKLGVGYAKYFNTKYERVGPLFQGPFKAVLVEKELYLKYLLVYINVVNPGQLLEPGLKEKGSQDAAAIMKFAEEYPWSTHQEYLQKRDSMIIDKGLLTKLFSDAEQYREFVRGVLLGRKHEQINNLFLE